jgi:hypothetical protein
MMNYESDRKIAPFSAESKLYPNLQPRTIKQEIRCKSIALFYSPLTAELLQLHKFVCSKSRWDIIRGDRNSQSYALLAAFVDPRFKNNVQWVPRDKLMA